MNTGTIGVAISTTGDEHRLGFLETCVRMWRAALPLGSVLVVTVDGDEHAATRARQVTDPSKFGTVYRVGQPDRPYRWQGRGGCLGVAVNKNTGLELLMDNYVEHLFLCDDDTYPLYPQALTKHTALGQPHSMVCWGKSRLTPSSQGDAEGYVEWAWPRGVMLYTHRSVVEKVGGMDERFGPGGHEHVEWSQRIHNAGLTPAPFITPVSYALRGAAGPAMRADALWHCEDMRKPGETGDAWDRRKRRNTSIRRKGSDWTHIDKIMAEVQGRTDFVPFRAHENGRSSATLWSSSSCAVEPETPRSEK